MNERKLSRPSEKIVYIIVSITLSLLMLHWYYSLNLVVSGIITIVISGSLIFLFPLRKHVTLKIAVIGSVLGSFWVISTYRYNYEPSVQFFAGLLSAFILTLFFSILTLTWATRIKPNATQISHDQERWIMGAQFCLMTIVWLFYWLAFYPGLLTNDSLNQWSIANGYSPLATWHPYIHTLLLEVSSKIVHTPALLLLGQLLFSAWAVTYALRFLQRRGISPVVTTIIALGYALYPLNGLYMSTVWKDIPYFSLILLLFVETIHLIESKGTLIQTPRGAFPYLLLLIATSLFRKNGYYVVIIVLILLLINQWSKHLLAIAVLTFLVVSSVNYWTNTVEHAVTSPVTEALGIPLQQVGAVYAKKGNVSSSNQKYFSKILPASEWATRYNSQDVDYLKYDSKFNRTVIQKSTRNFLTHWFSLFLRNKRLFVEAYLDQTRSIWKAVLPPDTQITIHGVELHTRKNSMYYQYQRAPKKTELLLHDNYKTYLSGSESAGQSPVSYKQYKTRVLNSTRYLFNDTNIPQIRLCLIKLYQSLANHQRLFARGGFITFVFLFAISICLCTLGWRYSFLTLAVPGLNLLTLLVSVPATDFRYIYSLGFSVIVILLYAVTAQRELPHKTIQKTRKENP
ncbi:DUF6020 family protein [Lacticaseibacillus paracasei]|uniref:DUF6020 family protein n=1 Tax=Lacticaseibacillus paracasei TaxID=1597 RepID=UPI000F0B14DB|nr:DUF6020 family protein [Lacticaseibacillus paracasei]RND51687.1 hypothetical protein FAM18121_02927 [Lacticaseibacillus paracasei]